MQVVQERKERDAKRKADEEARKKADEEAKKLAFAQANTSAAAVTIQVNGGAPLIAAGPAANIPASPTSGGYLDIPRGDTTFPRRNTMNRVSQIFATARRSHYFT